MLKILSRCIFPVGPFCPSHMCHIFYMKDGFVACHKWRQVSVEFQIQMLAPNAHFVCCMLPNMDSSKPPEHRVPEDE